jgi:hypothetical protein
MTAKKGINRDLLECLDFKAQNDNEAFSMFKSVVREYSFTFNQLRGFELAEEWFFKDALPNREWAVKLCFAFKLDEVQAADFIWKVCRLNGFCYRSASDIIYCYCLANKKTYAEARMMYSEYLKTSYSEKVAEYKEIVLERIKSQSQDYTVRTQTLRNKYANLKDMPEQVFVKHLITNAKYFIDFNISAYLGLVEQYNTVIAQLKKSRPADIGAGLVTIDEPDKDGFCKMVDLSYCFEDSTGALIHTHTIIDGDDEPRTTKFDSEYELSYATVWEQLSERVKCAGGTDEPLKRPTTPVGAIRNHMKYLLSLPTLETLKKLLQDPPRATEKERNSARMLFVFLYFAQYVIRWEHHLFDLKETKPKKPLFKIFYDMLNKQLEDCGYGYLYYANPFDWHILKCVSLLDEDWDNRSDYPDIIAEFNEALGQIA